MPVSVSGSVAVIVPVGGAAGSAGKAVSAGAHLLAGADQRGRIERAAPGIGDLAIHQPVQAIAIGERGGVEERQVGRRQDGLPCSSRFAWPFQVSYSPFSGAWMAAGAPAMMPSKSSGHR